MEGLFSSSAISSFDQRQHSQVFARLPPRSPMTDPDIESLWIRPQLLSASSS